MDKLQLRFDAMLSTTPTTFHRYLFNQINWEARLIGIKGPRGVGKTTLLLQRAKECLHRDTTLLVNADDLYFATHSLVDLADEFTRMGGQVLMIDEIHKYKEWSRELKLIYDYHRDLHVIFTGSSILDIMEGEADLSRRVLSYDMQGLSYREFLELEHGISLPVITLDDILHHQVDVIPNFKPYMYWTQYLQSGYYPFATDGNFEDRLSQVVNKTIEVDIPQYTEMSVAASRKWKQLLAIVAQSVPFKPNITSIAQVLGVSRNILPEWLVYMERAGLIGQLRDDTGGIRGLGKVEKVYLDNPNLMWVLSHDKPDVGNIRETFFYNQTRVQYDVIISKVSDFQIKDFTFEVGGRNKGQKQIQGMSNAYIVKDTIEQGYTNVLPLWLFGLLY